MESKTNSSFAMILNHLESARQELNELISALRQAIQREHELAGHHAACVGFSNVLTDVKRIDRCIDSTVEIVSEKLRSPTAIDTEECQTHLQALKHQSPSGELREIIKSGIAGTNHAEASAEDILSLESLFDIALDIQNVLYRKFCIIDSVRETVEEQTA